MTHKFKYGLIERITLGGVAYAITTRGVMTFRGGRWRSSPLSVFDLRRMLEADK